MIKKKVMKKNYDIQLNPRQPSSEEIDQYRDFDALLERFQSGNDQPDHPPVRRGRRLYYVIGLAAAAAVAALLIFYNTGPVPATEPALSAEAYFASQDFISPPLPAIEARYTSQTVDAAKGGNFAFVGGSRLVVPAAAFMDDRGRLIEGEIDLHYREMHDYVDFFLAGVPMVYDSADSRYYLESAGMIEIIATRNGKPVDLQPGKAIEVELVSEIRVPKVNVPPSYNIYQLDTAARQWVFRDVDHLQFLESMDPEANDPFLAPKQELIEQLAAIEAQVITEEERLAAELPLPAQPLPPQRADRNAATLELDLTDQAVADNDPRTRYEGVIWQVSPRSPEFDLAALSEEWTTYRIVPLNQVDYELTFIRADRQLRILVTPVLTGDDYDQAMGDYEKAMTAYRQALADRQAQLDERLSAARTRAAAERNAAQQQYENSLATLGADTGNSDALLRRKVVNRFTVTSLGIWNCDRPVPMEGRQVKAAFVDQKGKAITNNTAFLVNKSKNTVFRFYAGHDSPLRFEADEDNLLWVVTDEQQLAVFRPEDFEKIKKDKEEMTFRMTLVKREIEREEDVREILRF